MNLAAARVQLRRLADRGLVPGPRPSDFELLGSLGIDLAAIRRSSEQTSGRTARQLHASVGPPEGYRGAAGSLLAVLRVDLDQVAAAVTAELGGGQG